MSGLGRAGHYTDPLNLIYIFDTHKVVSTLRVRTPANGWKTGMDTWDGLLTPSATSPSPKPCWAMSCHDGSPLLRLPYSRIQRTTSNRTHLALGLLPVHR